MVLPEVVPVAPPMVDQSVLTGGPRGQGRGGSDSATRDVHGHPRRLDPVLVVAADGGAGDREGLTSSSGCDDRPPNLTVAVLRYPRESYVDHRPARTVEEDAVQRGPARSGWSCEPRAHDRQVLDAHRRPTGSVGQHGAVEGPGGGVVGGDRESGAIEGDPVWNRERYRRVTVGRESESGTAQRSGACGLDTRVDGRRHAARHRNWESRGRNKNRGRDEPASES